MLTTNGQTDSQKMEISKGAVIFLVILACVVACFIGYAIHYVSTNGFHSRDRESAGEISSDQKAYMQQVRDRNIRGLMFESRGHQSMGSSW